MDLLSMAATVPNLEPLHLFAAVLSQQLLL
jgi:hypothetical protein